ncbi:cobalt-precorrin-5B (C(1))-methyltransferase [Notoacmeibacter marinus]|uniref:Cobalt-precorrin-5B C(1)-methyltransferase n=1 Tax=Notoacmeibacter marinus TaxID=1876515 RepID=A0A231UUD0_9HYPH|nr:cobalt-precorrin-5B (C(1))-methyltransferase [Notoacmeibacter marinus]OXS99496.1 cobalt-precorrin-5B (C(1))-methyltransferase [Notoacmeibacter marinus]
MPSDRTNLRRGWTTGACATAAAKAAATALLGSDFPDPVTITLPGGQTPAFALAEERSGPDFAEVAIVKDAGDDPDVTHGALVRATVRRGESGAGVRFHAGAGVGTVTLAGLPVPPGEPAINPVPRKMIAAALEEVARAHGVAADFDVTVGIDGGQELALKTMNPRLGIVGGLSVLGTTGIVVPYSCAAWIHSIHRGIDVARAAGFDHVGGATGDASEKAMAAHCGFAEQQLIDMGDFVGGMLKYLRVHPVPKVTVAGGVAKMTKLAQGRRDLHSKHGRADLDALAIAARDLGGDDELAVRIAGSNTVAEAFDHSTKAGLPLGDHLAAQAWRTAAKILRQGQLQLLIFDREGRLRGKADMAEIDPAMS